jgi:hypothetical protein
MRERFDQHTETSPALTGGDVDADWESAYSVGDEAPGGDNPTPDQDLVDDIGRAVGVEYQDNEELKGDEKIADRDRHAGSSTRHRLRTTTSTELASTGGQTAPALSRSRQGSCSCPA